MCNAQLLQFIGQVYPELSLKGPKIGLPRHTTSLTEVFDLVRVNLNEKSQNQVQSKVSIYCRK